MLCLASGHRARGYTQLLGLVLAYQSFQALAYKNHFSDGVAALKRGANDVALVEFSSSITANKNSADAYLYRALAEVRLGDFQHDGMQYVLRFQEKGWNRTHARDYAAFLGHLFPEPS